jgi:hypothetical protein
MIRNSTNSGLCQRATLNLRDFDRFPVNRTKNSDYISPVNQYTTKDKETNRSGVLARSWNDDGSHRHGGKTRRLRRRTDGCSDNSAQQSKRRTSGPRSADDHHTTLEYRQSTRTPHAAYKCTPPLSLHTTTLPQLRTYRVIHGETSRHVRGRLAVDRRLAGWDSHPSGSEEITPRHQRTSFTLFFLYLHFTSATGRQNNLDNNHNNNSAAFHHIWPLCICEFRRGKEAAR